MKKIILITGGQRSGKSTKAEELALELSQNPVYLATAHIWDEEFRLRVQKHQERRGPEWTNIEEEKYLSKHDLTGRVVVIDCVTLWLTNWISTDNADVDAILTAAKHLHLRHQRDRIRWREHQPTATPIYRPARLDEPIHSPEIRRGDTDGKRHPRKDKINPC